MKVEKKKDFLSDLASRVLALKLSIDLECPDFSDDEAESTFRHKRAKDDFKFFCMTYFPHYLKNNDFSEFHEYLFQRLPYVVKKKEGAREVIGAPRGNAKSTFVTLCFNLWCLLTRRKRFAVILSDTIEQAAVHLAAIKTELESNPRLRRDWPYDVGAGVVWQAFEIILKNGAKIMTGGSGRSIRGARNAQDRPDLVICDDIENDTNVARVEQRNKIEGWLDKTVDALGPPDGSMDLIIVNTMLHYDSVCARKSRNPLWSSKIFRAVKKWPDRMDLWQRWEEVLNNDGADAAEVFLAAHKADMEAGAEVLWPGIQPIAMLMRKKALIKDSAFNAEYMNDPTDPDCQTFAKLHFWTERRNWLYVGACDPSLGKNNKSSDPSAILIGGYDRETGVISVVEAQIRRRVPALIIEDIISLQAEYGCLFFGIEAVQFQSFFADKVSEAAAARHVHVPVIPLHNSIDKALRIESIQPYTERGLIRIHHSQTVLLEQLRNWPKAAHDDGPDALEMLWRVRPVLGVGVRSRSRSSGRINDYVGG